MRETLLLPHREASRHRSTNPRIVDASARAEPPAARHRVSASCARNSEILRKASTDDASSIADRDSVPARSQRSVKLQWRSAADATCHRLAEREAGWDRWQQPPGKFYHANLRNTSSREYRQDAVVVATPRSSFGESSIPESGRLLPSGGTGRANA